MFYSECVFFSWKKSVTLLDFELGQDRVGRRPWLSDAKTFRVQLASVYQVWISSEVLPDRIQLTIL